MSTEPDHDDAPLSGDDATQPNDADDERQVLWRVTPELDNQLRTNPELLEQFKEAVDRFDEQVNAYSESILLAAFRYNVHAETPAPLPSPIHPKVTIDDMRNVDHLLTDIIIALRDGDRHFLNKLKYAVQGIAIATNDAPNPAIKADRQRFYLWRFVHLISAYHRFPETDTLNRPNWFKGLGAHFAEYDPAFAKLDDASVETVCKEINFKPTGKGAKGWIKAAATLAVRVGAFDSATLGTTEKQRIDKLDSSLGKLWSTRDEERFPEPPLPKPTDTKR